MYNSLVERCFRDCVDTFRRKDLEPAEEKVRVSHCCRRGSEEPQKGQPAHALTTHTHHAHSFVRTHTHTHIIQCVQKCCEKYMKHSSRVGLRFAELSSQVREREGKTYRRKRVCMGRRTAMLTLNAALSLWHHPHKTHAG